MTDLKKYQGVIVPMITPFTMEGKIDTDAVHRIIDHLIAGGVNGIFALGTTGEATSISMVEKDKMVKATVDYTRSRIPVYAGISSNCLDESIKMAKRYVVLGIDVLVAYPPCYYSLNDDEMLRYFMKLADSVAGPLMIYNIPKTTGLSISIDIAEKLSHHERIVGFKDSENTPGRLEEAIERFTNRNDFSYVVGCAVLSAKSIGLGAAGIVPSTGNLQPQLYTSLVNHARNGNVAEANELQEQTNVISSLYQKNRSLGQSLAALKAVMHILGFCEPTVLAPLETLQQDDIAKIKEQMTKIIPS